MEEMWQRVRDDDVRALDTEQRLRGKMVSPQTHQEVERKLSGSLKILKAFHINHSPVSVMLFIKVLKYCNYIQKWGKGIYAHMYHLRFCTTVFTLVASLHIWPVLFLYVMLKNKRWRKGIFHNPAFWAILPICSLKIRRRNGTKGLEEVSDINFSSLFSHPWA